MRSMMCRMMTLSSPTKEKRKNNMEEKDGKTKNRKANASVLTVTAPHNEI